MLCSKVIASFTSSIGTAIYKVLLVVIHSYPNDDSETATFDLTIATDIIVMADHSIINLCIISTTNIFPCLCAMAKSKL